MSSQLDEPVCDPRVLDTTEVRARVLYCGDDKIQGGHGVEEIGCRKQSPQSGLRDVGYIIESFRRYRWWYH